MNKEYNSSPTPENPTAKELFAVLKIYSHRAEGWEVVNTASGGLCLRQSINAMARTPEYAICNFMKQQAKD